jgi:phosphatidate cytidylyltransferase
VFGLKEKTLKYQIKNYVAAINGSIYVVIAINGIILSHCIGLFWGIFTMGGVTCNDLFAYIMGKSFGRTQLISLSPNKTLEGFLGGAFWTVIFALLCLSQIFSFPMLLCEA